MKKIVFFIFLLMALPLALFGQEPTVPPVSWGEVFSNPALWLGSFAGVSLLTAFIAAFLNGFLKIIKGFPKQLVAWVVAILITTIAGAVVNLKIVYTWELPIWLAVLHGFFAGLAGNGAFDIPVLKSILKSIEAIFVKPKV
jgi:hypothetical protein